MELDKTRYGHTDVDKIVGFHMPDEPHGCFSNWALSPFTYAGIRYEYAEQYMMAQKVLLGGRRDLWKRIMESDNPKEIKDFAGKESFPEFMGIKSFWDKHCKQIVKRGVKAKFQQNPDILQELLNTNDALLCECAARDKIWGIGINLKDPAWHYVSNWDGKNYLGRILMEVREELRRDICENGRIQYIDYRNAAAIPEWTMTAGQLKRIPQFYDAVHAYADQLSAGRKDAFYNSRFADMESEIRADKAESFPTAGFFELKQDVFAAAHGLRHCSYVSNIFHNRPRQFGLRGDSYFWDDLQTEFAFTTIAITERELVDKVYTLFKAKTGEDLTLDAVCYVEEYAHGGMSSGQLSGDWIVNKCIPMLKQRLKNLKSSVLEGEEIDWRS